MNAPLQLPILSGKTSWCEAARLADLADIYAPALNLVYLPRELPGIIARYNVSVGGVNDDTQGYHETLTQLYVAGVRAFAARHPAPELAEAVNVLLAAPEGRRDWPLGFYSRDRLFSVEARRNFVTPDLAPLPTLA